MAVATSLDPQWKAFVDATAEASAARSQVVRQQHVGQGMRAIEASGTLRRYVQALRDVDRTLADLERGIQQGRELVRSTLGRLEAVR
jgi:hypothetical protein